MTRRMLDVIRFLAVYYTLTSKQIGYLLGMNNPRVVRRILQGMYEDKLINKTRMEVVPRCGSSAPVYFPGEEGSRIPGRGPVRRALPGSAHPLS